MLLGLALSDRIRRLRVDRDQAEAILRLTLPDPIAERLKQGEVAIADRHAQVAVLFADLAGFTPLSASHPPETLVRLLDALFSEMDALAHRVGAEKIKTIGDCYMVVAGAPRSHPDPVAALADLALGLPQATARAVERVRPKMMTVVAIMAGLLPIMWSTGTGSEVMSRIAAPMVGGMVSSTILTLCVIPAIYGLVKQYELRR